MTPSRMALGLTIARRAGYTHHHFIFRAPIFHACPLPPIPPWLFPRSRDYYMICLTGPDIVVKQPWCEADTVVSICVPCSNALSDSAHIPEKKRGTGRKHGHPLKYLFLTESKIQEKFRHNTRSVSSQGEKAIINMWFHTFIIHEYVVNYSSRRVT